MFKMTFLRMKTVQYVSHLTPRMVKMIPGRM